MEIEGCDIVEYLAQFRDKAEGETVCEKSHLVRRQHTDDPGRAVAIRNNVRIHKTPGELPD